MNPPPFVDHRACPNTGATTLIILLHWHLSVGGTYLAACEEVNVLEIKWPI